MSKPSGAGAPTDLDAFGWRELRRALLIAVILIASIARAIVTGARRDRCRSWRVSVAQGVADGFERLGPTFVKVGQLVTSSPGLFPPPLVAACRGHLYRVTPITADDVRTVITAELGGPIEDHFSSFDDEPLSLVDTARSAPERCPQRSTGSSRSCW